MNEQNLPGASQQLKLEDSSAGGQIGQATGNLHQTKIGQIDTRLAIGQVVTIVKGANGLGLIAPIALSSLVGIGFSLARSPVPPLVLTNPAFGAGVSSRDRQPGTFLEPLDRYANRLQSDRAVAGFLQEEDIDRAFSTVAVRFDRAPADAVPRAIAPIAVAIVAAPQQPQMPFGLVPQHFAGAGFGFPSDGRIRSSFEGFGRWLDGIPDARADENDATPEVLERAIAVGEDSAFFPTGSASERANVSPAIVSDSAQPSRVRTGDLLGNGRRPENVLDGRQDPAASDARNNDVEAENDTGGNEPSSQGAGANVSNERSPTAKTSNAAGDGATPPANSGASDATTGTNNPNGSGALVPDGLDGVLDLLGDGDFAGPSTDGAQVPEPEMAIALAAIAVGFCRLRRKRIL